MEDALRQSEERWRLAADNTGLGTFDFDPRTGKLIWSDVSKSYFGLPPDAVVDDATFRKGVHPEDRDRVQGIVDDAMRPESRGEYATEYRTIGINDGKERWISAWGRVLFDRHKQPERFIGLMLDISEKKRREKAAEATHNEIRALAASLLTAQEEERRRVSRELHDQICQQLAALSIDIGALAVTFPSPEDAQKQLKALQVRLVKAAEETRLIAYQLHPSVVDDLGLMFAMRALCEEFSERQDVAVEFDGGTLPGSIPREIGACLYRVAQESLQNVAKHSDAKHVSVTLSLNNTSLVLSIEDDGVGFNTETVKGKGGLGLISMNERVRSVNGTLSIVSRPSHGARITVQIPVAPRVS
jgi:PAS domain S-box-containing protein